MYEVWFGFLCWGRGWLLIFEESFVAKAVGFPSRLPFKITVKEDLVPLRL